VGSGVHPKISAFPLRLPEAERERVQKLAAALGYSENRLYAELMHEGLLMHEQMAYMAQLRALHVCATEGLALLALAPDVEPEPEERLLEAESA
jgi:DNA-binding LacI/PurR family transcriptional regulator